MNARSKRPAAGGSKRFSFAARGSRLKRGSRLYDCACAAAACPAACHYTLTCQHRNAFNLSRPQRRTQGIEHLIKALYTRSQPKPQTPIGQWQAMSVVSAAPEACALGIFHTSIHNTQ